MELGRDGVNGDRSFSNLNFYYIIMILFDFTLEVTAISLMPSSYLT